MRESTVESYLCATVLAVAGLTRKLEWTGRPHAPDQLVVLPTVGTVLVEVKRPGETPRPGQEREHARLRAAGARVEVVSSFEEVDAFIEKYTNMTPQGIDAILASSTSELSRRVQADIARLRLVDILDERRQKSSNMEYTRS